MPSPYHLLHPERLLSPSLVIFEEIVRANLDAAIAMVGDVDRLRPHVKTHKMRAIVALQESLGLHKHKCATIAEAEMIAQAGGRDVLVAYPLVGPNLGRFTRLVRAYPQTTFRALVDDPEMARALSKAAAGLDRPVPTLLDLDVGMGRTGIAPGDAAAALCPRRRPPRPRPRRTPRLRRPDQGHRPRRTPRGVRPGHAPGP